jgi:hypothetical protein
MSGIVLAWSCGPCRAETGMTGREYAPGRFSLGAMHASHAPELTALGWEVITYAHELPDLVCPHYAALCAAAEDEERS